MSEEKKLEGAALDDDSLEAVAGGIEHRRDRVNINSANPICVVCNRNKLHHSGNGYKKDYFMCGRCDILYERMWEGDEWYGYIYWV